MKKMKEMNEMDTINTSAPVIEISKILGKYKIPIALIPIVFEKVLDYVSKNTIPSKS